MIEMEIAIRNELQQTFETILQHMEQLEALNVIPEDLPQRDVVTYRALDLRSASMVFLAVTIRHHSRFGGIPGNFNL